MGQPMVLPKFEPQGDRPHWVLRAAWVAGGLLLLSIIGLAGVLMHHRTLETRAYVANADVIARAKVEAEAKIAAAAAAVPGIRAERRARAAMLAAQSVPATTAPATGTMDAAPSGPKATVSATTVLATGTTHAAPSGPKPTVAVHHHHARSSHGGKGRKISSKAVETSASRMPPSSTKTDAIDDLLKRMSEPNGKPGGG